MAQNGSGFAACLCMQVRWTGQPLDAARRESLGGTPETSIFRRNGTDAGLGGGEAELQC